ncbi:MAG: hypothetical protein AABZ61_08040, partial [Bacteroidota bacterium]
VKAKVKIKKVIVSNCHPEVDFSRPRDLVGHWKIKRSLVVALSASLLGMTILSKTSPSHHKQNPLFEFPNPESHILDESSRRPNLTSCILHPESTLGYF